MIKPPKPPNEVERLAALRGYEILDPPFGVQPLGCPQWGTR